METVRRKRLSAFIQSPPPCPERDNVARAGEGGGGGGRRGRRGRVAGAAGPGRVLPAAGRDRARGQVDPDGRGDGVGRRAGVAGGRGGGVGVGRLLGGAGGGGAADVGGGEGAR